MRISLLALILGLCLFLGILFRAFVVDYLIRPVAVMLWLCWQIVLSVDQKFYWGLLIFLALFYAFRRLSQKPAASVQAPESFFSETLNRVRYWRSSILLTRDEIDAPNILKRDLGQMLVTMHATTQPEASNFEIHNALKQRRIPLPDPIHSFLFPVEPSGSTRSFKRILRTIRQTPREWVRRWTGRDMVDYYKSIEDVLTILESTLEITHDDEHLDSRNA